MAVANPNESKGFLGGLARRLVADGLIEDAKARELQQSALKSGKPLVSLIVEEKLMSARDIASSASTEFGAPLMDMDALDLDPAVTGSISEKLIQKHHALPLFKRGKRVFVGVSDPTNLQALDEIKFATGGTTEAILVEEDKLTKAIESAISAADSAAMDIGDEDLDNLEISDGSEDEGGDDVTASEADEAPIVRYVNKVLLDAINKGASDIHFEPYEKTYRIRFRMDGILKEMATPPVAMGGRLAARVKVMSRMDLAEKRVPQDGRIS